MMPRRAALLRWGLLVLLLVTVSVFGALSVLEQRRLAAQDAVATTPSVLPNDPVRGPVSAAVTVIEYGDFQCEFCRLLEPELRRLLNTYPQQLRLVWKDFPITDQHAEALQAAQAARCAGEQGAFWEMHEALLQQQQHLSAALYVSLAQDLGLQQQPFAACMEDVRVTAAIEQDARKAAEYGVDGTPYFFINGARLSNVASAQALRRTIQQALP